MTLDTARPRRPRGVGVRTCLTVLLLLLPAQPAWSQQPCLLGTEGAVKGDCGMPPPAERSSNAGGYLGGAALNAAIGGLTSGIFRGLAGEAFVPAFLKGAAGGTVTFAGRAVSGRQFSGAGFLGREIAAVGSSMVANASAGRGLAERVTLPVGPVNVHVNRSAGTSLSMSVDVLATMVTTYAVAHRDYDFDWRSSLSAGAPVFRSPSLLQDRSWSGAMVAGVIVLNHERSVPGVHRVQAHEQVHVAQHDFSAMVWGEPLERLLLGLLPYGDVVGRRADVGIDFLFWAGLHSVVSDRRSTPWEREARLLSRR